MLTAVANHAKATALNSVQAADGAGDELDLADVDAGEPRRVIGAADREEVAAHVGLVEHEGHDQGDNEEDDDRDRDAEHVALAEELDAVGQAVDCF